MVRQTGEALEAKELPFAINNNTEVHQLELERIFSQNWSFIGHVSEVPDEGDYVQRYVGTDPYIFARDEDGEYQVFLDICPHRGTKIVQSEEGNSAHFRCPYHGWTFKNTGELAGVPYSGAYDEADLEDMDLYSPRVDEYRGLVFATLNDDLPPLADYLGEEYRWYLDLFFGLTNEGHEVIAGPDSVDLNINWKMGAENFTADWYHFPMAHKSSIDIGMHPGLSPWGASVVCDGEGATHTVTTALVDEEDVPMYFSLNRLYGDEAEEILNDDLDEDQRALAGRMRGGVGNIFPNTSFIQVRAYTAIHKWRPVGPGQTRLQTWVLGPKEYSAETREQARKEYVRFGNSPSALIATDDHPIWNRVTEASGSTFNTVRNIQGKYTLGDGAGIDGLSAEEHLHPRGEVVGHYAANEGTELAFRRMWYDAMRNGGGHVD